MKTTLTELPMYGYWPGSVFMYVRRIEVCVCAHCVCGRVGREFYVLLIAIYLRHTSRSAVHQADIFSKK